MTLDMMLLPAAAASPALARPGPRWGLYPVRDSRLAPCKPAATLWGRWTPPVHCPPAWLLRWHRPWLKEVQAMEAAWAAMRADEPARQAALAGVRDALRRDGLTAATVARGLACVMAGIQATTGRRLHEVQLVAAAHVLDQTLVEMATGEGKSLVMMAACAVAALAGVPVHLITANDYLAERDAQALAPLAEWLGLSVAHVPPLTPPEAKRGLYACDIVCATAKELAFDHLRDRLALPGTGHEQPVMRGLCLALIDEADSILLDEAVVPLVISTSRPEPAHHAAARRALWWQARRLAAALRDGDDIVLHPATTSATLTPSGQARIDERAGGLGGLWRRPATRHQLVCLAAVADRLLRRDKHYLVRDGRVELLDVLTGRVAAGRVWSQGLQTLVELKEGCAPSAPTETLGQLTFQRFFQRYWRMGGLSGTLTEARRELQETYGVAVRRMPLRQPSRRIDLPLRHFPDADSRWRAVAERAEALRAQGRPVLIGTDTVADSERLSAELTRRGVPHSVLNARHDHDEARIIAQAGQAGRVTVATRMAGRGTDILLDERALAAGGLHVIACQRNESRRMDRQLLGRAGRQGQPGSTEAWICSVNSGECSTVGAPKLSRWRSSVAGPWSSPPRWWVACAERWSQWIEEQRQAGIRRHLLEQDRQWEEQHGRRGRAR